MQSTYPAKLLLFGEYTIINGSMALAVPYEHYFGRWTFERDREDEGIIEASRDSIRKIFFYLRDLRVQKVLKSSLNFEQFAQDLEQGLWFNSTIPTGYGAGSSGAVCAAIYDRYAQSKATIYSELQEVLAQIEGYFHGKSSGIDPLVCYLQQSLIIDRGTIKPLTQKEQTGLFLIDTGISRSTPPLVNYYLEQSESKYFQRACIHPLIDLNKRSIQAFVEQKNDRLLDLLKEIGSVEYQFLQRMIPAAFWEIWQAGMEASSEYALKLCGAGGGGFILGYSKDWRLTERRLSGYRLELIQ